MVNKQWETPQLIVYCRGRTEEAVLKVCKTHNDPSGPASADNWCKAMVTKDGKHFCTGACKGVTGT